MEQKNKFEDYDVCKNCGGKCCIKCGCDYSALDFEDLSFNKLCEILSEGKISVVSMVSFRKITNGKTIADLFLYLRARNEDRDIIDLISMKTKCSLLTENGCSYSYEERPTGGKNLVPVAGGLCYPNEDPFKIMETWIPYQNVLRKVVKRYAGKSVESKAREDVENLFYRIFCNDFDGVAPLEIADLRGFVPRLMEVYPNEVSKAKAKYDSQKCKVLNNLEFKK